MLNHSALWVEITGWTGSILIVLAYALNSFQKVRSDSAAFPLLNLAGGLLLIFYTVQKDAFASTFINLIWVAIAVMALTRIFRRRPAEPERW